MAVFVLLDVDISKKSKQGCIDISVNIFTAVTNESTEASIVLVPLNATDIVKNSGVS